MINVIEIGLHSADVNAIGYANNYNVYVFCVLLVVQVLSKVSLYHSHATAAGNKLHAQVYALQ